MSSLIVFRQKQLFQSAGIMQIKSYIFEQKCNNCRYTVVSKRKIVCRYAKRNLYAKNIGNKIDKKLLPLPWWLGYVWCVLTAMSLSWRGGGRGRASGHRTTVGGPHPPRPYILPRERHPLLPPPPPPPAPMRLCNLCWGLVHVVMGLFTFYSLLLILLTL